MKNLVKMSVWLAVVALVTANIILFRYSIGLGKEIETYENKTKTIHEENLRLEKQISSLTSLEFAKEIAEELNFSKVANPTFLVGPGVAYNVNP